MEHSNLKISVNLEFEPIKLPPVRDILVLGSRFPQGKVGVMECFRFIAPDEFEMFDVDDGEEIAEAVLIHKRILRRIDLEEIMQILREHVFPRMSKGEAIKVDLNLRLEIEGIEIARGEK